jgi:glycosyltransferase involved in cell wall biosynthesis
VRLLSVIHGPVFGGAHNQALRLAPLLAERGVQTLAVVPPEGADAAARLRGAGVETITMPLHRLRATPRPGVQARFLGGLGPEVGRLRRLIRERRINVVQAHGPTNPHAALAARLERDVAVVWQILDTRAPRILRAAMMPTVVRLSDAITAWGDALARAHPGAAGLGERLIIVYPPVDAVAFAPDPAARAAARAGLNVSGDEPVIGTVGVLNPQKGHEHLIRAAGIAARAHPDLAVRILGAASPAHRAYGRRLRADAAAAEPEGDRRRFDFVDPEFGVRTLLRALDVFVLASVPRSEGMPTAVLEAMACAKPVVATDVGAVRELVEDGVTGLVVPPSDDEALATAITRLLDDGRLREAIGSAARRRATERFGLQRLADLHLRAYELARAHRSRSSAAR